MTLEQFIEKVTSALEKHYGEDYRVRTLEVKKNNGVCLHGLSVFLKEGDDQVAPTIYLDEFYERYQDGVTMSETIRKLIDIYESCTIKEKTVSMDFFADYEKVRDRVVYKLVNYRMNEELLKEIPYIMYLDLAVVFYYYMENEKIGAASILIHDTHVKKWGVSMERLIADAEYNTPRVLGHRIANMEEMVRELIRNDVREKCRLDQDDGRQGEEREAFSVEELTDKMMDCFLEGEEKNLMYVLTNRCSQNGAACIRYPNVLKEFAERMGSDLYILPSSIHEVILLRSHGLEDDAGALRNMVKDVNRTQLAPEEVLSNQVYYYSRKSGKVGICESKTNVK